jgi:hypothetical protein
LIKIKAVFAIVRIANKRLNLMPSSANIVVHQSHLISLLITPYARIARNQSTLKQPDANIANQVLGLIQTVGATILTTI